MKALMLVFVFGAAALVSGEPAQAKPPTEKTPCSIEIEAPNPIPPGSAVPISVQLTNTSDQDINASSVYEMGMDISYGYDVRRTNGHESAAIHPEFPAVAATSDIAGTLRPGESVHRSTTIGLIFHLAPGTYTVQLSRDVRDALGNRLGVSVKSNTITITIVPPPFSIEISTPKTEVKAGTPVPLDIRMTNISKSQLAFGAPPEEAGIDSHFMYACRKDGAKDVSWKGNLSQDAAPLFSLKPGEARDQRVDIASACDLRQPGTYQIWVWRYDPQGPQYGSVKSNEIGLTVKP